METLILDAPSASALAKKRRVVDSPIHLQFIDPEAGSRDKVFYCWYVIESRCGSTETEAAARGVLADELWIHKSEEDTFRSLNLPYFHCPVDDAVLLASKSHLVLIGNICCSVCDPDRQTTSILYIDLQHPQQKWKRCDTWGKGNLFLNGAAVSDDGDWIYLVQETKVIRFKCDNVEEGKILTDLYEDNDRPKFLLALTTGSKMLMYHPAGQYICAGYYDLESQSWTMIDAFPIRTLARFWRGLDGRTLLVRDSFLIFYSESHPMRPGDFSCGLYVYDMRHNKWFSEPVQGLISNDLILPSTASAKFGEMIHVSLMRVRKDVLKLAFVWSILKEDEGDDDHNEVHWSKFILRIQENEAQDISPTFHAEGLSFGIINGGDTHLINSTVG